MEHIANIWARWLWLRRCIGAAFLVLVWGGVQQARRNLAESKTARSEELVARDRMQAERHKRAEKPE